MSEDGSSQDAEVWRPRQRHNQSKCYGWATGVTRVMKAGEKIGLET